MASLGPKKAIPKLKPQSVSLTGKKASENGETLSSVYHSANSLFQKVKESMLSSNDPEHIKLVKEAANNVTKVKNMVNTLALFSDNEELRDVSSVNLKYLLCDFMLGDLFLNLHEQKYREICIREGLKYLTKFLGKCRDLKMLSKQDIALFERKGRPGPIASARTEKINRLKRTRAIKGELQALLKLEKEKVDKEGIVDDDELEEDERERRKGILMIRLAISECWDQMRFALDEKKMLEFRKKHMEKNKGKEPQARSERRKEKNTNSILHIRDAKEFMRQAGIIQPRHIGNTPALQSLTQKMQGISMAPMSVSKGVATSILGRPDPRTQVVNEMFRPRNLPTMTVDELIDLEIKQGKIKLPDKDEQRRIALEKKRRGIKPEEVS